MQSSVKTGVTIAACGERLASHSEGLLTDLRLARRMVNEHGDDLRHCHGLGRLVWTGKAWEPDTTGEWDRRAKATVIGLYREAAEVEDKELRGKLWDFARKHETLQAFNNLCGIVETEPGIPVRIEELDADPMLLNVANGTVNLRTGELHQHRRDELITKLCPISFRSDSDADCPQFTAFINRIFGDAELIAYMQRLAGYSITGVVAEHVLPIGWGGGANGKSTWVNMWLRILGSYASMAAPKLLIQRKHDGHPTEIARLLGQRFVATVESGERSRLDEERVKMLTGGDELVGRLMKKDFFKFRPSHKLMLCTNHKPLIGGCDMGIWRRIHLIPFTVTIPPQEQIVGLADKLVEEEGPAILGWAVHGCLQWQEQGLNPPECVTAATAAYRGESDVLGNFLAECCTTDKPGALAAASELYSLFGTYCTVNGEEAMTQTAFGRELADRGFHKAAHGSSKRVHFGSWFLS